MCCLHNSMSNGLQGCAGCVVGAVETAIKDAEEAGVNVTDQSAVCAHLQSKVRRDARESSPLLLRQFLIDSFAALFASLPGGGLLLCHGDLPRRSEVLRARDGIFPCMAEVDALDNCGTEQEDEFGCDALCARINSVVPWTSPSPSTL